MGAAIAVSSKTAVVVLIVTFTAYSTPVEKTNAVETEWTLFKIDLKKHPHARCLDGTPGGYWFSKGSGTGERKFVIHHMVRAYICKRTYV